MQFMSGSAILKSSGMVNDFKECTARILIWQKPGLLGLFAVFIYSYRRKIIVWHMQSVLRQEVVRALFCMQKGEGLVVINDHRIDKILEKKEVMLYNNNICMDNFARRKS